MPPESVEDRPAPDRVLIDDRLALALAAGVGAGLDAVLAEFEARIEAIVRCGPGPRC